MVMHAPRIDSFPVSGPGNIVHPSSRFEKVAGRFRFVEGPAWHPVRDFLVFSDIIGNVMYRWSWQDGLDVFRKPSNMANGTTWDHQGNLLVCEHATSRVSRLDKDNNYRVLASSYDGLELNSPNDIVVRSNGDIYFTDPNSGRGAKYGVERKQELDFQGVYRLDPGSGALTLLVDDFSKPNGLCFSQDETRMFINDTDRQHIRVFDVPADGTLSNGRLWASVGGDDPGVADGMKVDSAGNLYCCGSGGIHVFDPDGNRIGVIQTPEVAANFTWGGIDRTEMFITATHTVYRLRVKIPGQGV